jgi:hypothetical protein
LIDRNDIVRTAREFEESHADDSFRVYDWDAWPTLRIRACGEALHSDSRGAFRKYLGSIAHGLPSVERRIRSTFASARLRKEIQLDLPNRQEPDAPGHPVTLLTLSQRRWFDGRSHYEIYTDPLRESLHACGVEAMVWERGTPTIPRFSPSAWIDARLDAEAVAERGVPMPKCPDGFAEYAQWASGLLGRRVAWSEVAVELRRIEAYSRVFGRWLERSGSRLFLVVCWYDPMVMAATLASRRLGIPVVDLQHGLQGRGHYAYDGWIRRQDAKPSLVPDGFWLWGESDARAVRANNPGLVEGTRFVTGGFPWLNRWLFAIDERLLELRRSAKEAVKGANRSILVTLQKAVDLRPILEEAILRAPSDWAWLVRLHRSMAGERAEWERWAEAKVRGRVRIAAANDLPLYALLSAVDAHVTAFSTCALEALAFGVPSVAIGSEGRDAFSLFISHRVMYSADDGPELLRALERCGATRQEDCTRQAQSLFADPRATDFALRQLLTLANIQ